MMRRTRIAAVVGGAFVLTGGAAAYAAKTFMSPAEQQKAVVADVANRLGVTPQKLTDAVTQALLDRIDAAVAAGQISADQATRLKARIKAGNVPMFGGPLGRGFGGQGGGFGHRGMRGGLDAAATFLGLTPDALRAQLESGTSLADVAAAQKRSVADLKAALLAAITKQVNDAVTAGRISKEMGAQIIARQSAGLDAMIARKGDGRGPGDGHGSGPGGPPPGPGTGAAPFGSAGAVPSGVSGI
jgi:hypothetical protein